MPRPFPLLELPMRRQAGLSFFGFLGFLLLAGFLAFLAMRLFPVYSEYYNVSTSLKGLAGDPETSGKDPGQIKKMLVKRMEISYVENVKAENIKVSRSGSDTEVTVAYEVRRPLAYNLDYVASFEKTVTLRKGGDAE